MSPVRPSRPVRRRAIPSLTLSLLLALVLAALPATLRAQAGAVRERPHRIVSINPFGLVLDFFALEYEHAFSPSASGAFSISHVELGDDERHFSMDAKYRLYPSERGPEGLAVAIIGGYTHVRNDFEECAFTGSDCASGRDSGGALTTGLSLDYTWMLGSRKHFVIAIGAGAKRLYFIGDRVRDVNRTAPTGRFMLGRAF